MIKRVVLALTLANLNWAATTFRGDPTGKSDNAAPLQEAIDALAPQGGGTLVIPKGTYAMSTRRPTTQPCKFTNIRAPSSLTLEGEPDTQRRLQKGRIHHHRQHLPGIYEPGASTPRF